MPIKTTEEVLKQSSIARDDLVVTLNSGGIAYPPTNGGNSGSPVVSVKYKAL